MVRPRVSSQEATNWGRTRSPQTRPSCVPTLRLSERGVYCAAREIPSRCGRHFGDVTVEIVV